MTRLILFVLSALLALLSVVHAKTDQIRVYAFTSDYCYGPPAGSNMDIKRNKCKNVPNGARSIKPMLDSKRDGWVDDVNTGILFCEVITYSVQDCVEGAERNSVPVPEELEQCLHPGEPGDSMALFSVKFECKSEYVSTATPWFLVTLKTFANSTCNRRTTTKVITSWSTGNDDKLTPHETTTVHSLTSAFERNVVTESPGPAAHHLEPRNSKKHHNSEGKWMLHPWSLSLLCYECWTMKEDNFDDFRCHSGPKNVVDCGPVPKNLDGGEYTSTVPGTTTDFLTLPKTLYDMTTVHTTQEMVTVTETATATLEMLEERRSFHKRVTFDSPYKPGTRVCGEAEWQKRGQSNTQIEISKVGRDMKKCDKAKAQSLDVPKPVVETEWYTTTTPVYSATIETYTVTETDTIMMMEVSTDNDEEELSIPAHRDL